MAAAAPSPLDSAAAASFSAEEVKCMQSTLLAWYDRVKRRLPWRGDAPPYSGDSSTGLATTTIGETELLPAPAVTPYGVWVSEIMLQQTRVDAVIRHYLAWMLKFPSIATLADAHEDAVVAAWAGLGYYSRARNLHKAAKEVICKHNGTVPSDLRQLKALPGVGDYTSGAVASIAFGAAVPAVDGNVIRVISRLRALALDSKSPVLHRSVVAAATQLVAGCDRPGDFNQSLMELGATVCAPAGPPKCDVCPLWGGALELCKAHGVVATEAKECAAAVDIEDAVGPHANAHTSIERLTSKKAKRGTAPSSKSQNVLPPFSDGSDAAQCFNGAVIGAESAAILDTSSRGTATRHDSSTTSSPASDPAVRARIAQLFPRKEAKKKAAIPLHAVTVAVVEVVAEPVIESLAAVAAPSQPSRRYLFLRASATADADTLGSGQSSSSSSSNSANDAIVASSSSPSKSPSSKQPRKKKAPSHPTSLSAAAASHIVHESGADVVSSSRLLHGLWAPHHMVREGGALTSSSSDPILTSATASSVPVLSSAAVDFASIEPSLRRALAHARFVIGQLESEKDAAAQLSLTSSNSGSGSILPSLSSASTISRGSLRASLRLLSRRACPGVIRHAFSHVHHDISTQHWLCAVSNSNPGLVSVAPHSDAHPVPKGKGAAKRKGVATATQVHDLGGDVSADADEAAALYILGGSSSPSQSFAGSSSSSSGRSEAASFPLLEAVFATPSQFPALGLSTWAAKALFPALKDTAAREIARADSSSSSSRGSVINNDADLRGWLWLAERWKKAGCKLPSVSSSTSVASAAAAAASLHSADAAESSSSSSPLARTAADGGSQKVGAKRTMSRT